MKHLFLFFFVSLSFTSYAEDSVCLEKLQNSMQTESEKYLSAKHFSNVAKAFELNCKASEYDLKGLLEGIILVHEAAHFEDLSIDVNSLDAPTGFNIYLANNTHIGALENYQTLPVVKSIIRPLLANKFSELLAADSFFMDMHDAYIGAEDAMAADDLRGMSSELNGYTHGARYENRIKNQSDLIPEIVVLTLEGRNYEVPNPHKAMYQTDGIYYFLFSFNLYLQTLEQDYPDQLAEFLTENNRNFLTKIFDASIEVLNETKRCNITQHEDNAKSWQKLLNSVELSPVMKILLTEKNVKSLLCL